MQARGEGRKGGILKKRKSTNDTGSKSGIRNLCINFANALKVDSPSSKLCVKFH